MSLLLSTFFVVYHSCLALYLPVALCFAWPGKGNPYTQLADLRRCHRTEKHPASIFTLKSSDPMEFVWFHNNNVIKQYTRQ